jgi:hypothetical protein
MTRNTKISVGLSILAVVGVGATAFLSAKNSRNYYHVLSLTATDKWDALPDEEYEEREDEPWDAILTKKDKAIIFGKTFWPTLVAGSLTAACIVGAQVIDIREILGLSAGLAAVTCKYNDINKFLQEKYPEQYKEAKRYADGEAARRAIEEKPKKEEYYDGRKRYYFPLSDQIVYMKPEDMIKVQGFIGATIGTQMEIILNEILDYIHYDLGYKDVHISDKDYLWVFGEDTVEPEDFPRIELEYDDIYDEGDTERVVSKLCQVVHLSREPDNYEVVDI